MLREMEKEYEGFSKAVKAVMREAERGALRGVRGPVAKLIHAEDRYALAIETAPGRGYAAHCSGDLRAGQGRH